MNKKINSLIVVIFFSMINLIFAADWYVKPAGGDYGNEDGTSYDNAWDGLLSVVWGANGVQPGDTLWVCGTHVYKMPSLGAGLVTVADITPASGTSDSSRVTVRGDYPGDAGVIWGGYIPQYTAAGWQQQASPNQNVWSYQLIGGHYADWYFQDVSASGYTVLDPVASISECNSAAGSVYYDSSTKILYVQTTDSSDPTDRITCNRYGYDFKMNGKEYITFKNLTFNSLFTHPFISTYSAQSMSHINFEGCKFSYGEHFILEFGDNCDYNKVIDCELAWAGNAIYTISTTNDAASYYLFQGNYIHDIGVRAIQQNSDAHSIGIQGGIGGVIENNICVNCGTGPLLYAYTNQELRDTIVRNNFIKDLHQLGNASGYGVSTMCNNDSMSDKSGNLFYNNIVVNANVGYRLQFEDEQEVMHNIAYNCNYGLESGRSYNGVGANVTFKNNIIMNSQTYHVRWYSGASGVVINFDNNIYYPDTGTKFYEATLGGAMNFSDWQDLSKTNCSFDPSSSVSDPLFCDGSGSFSKASDFRVEENSPAIDSGETLDITEAYDGYSRDSASDIGPFEQNDSLGEGLIANFAMEEVWNGTTGCVIDRSRHDNNANTYSTTVETTTSEYMLGTRSAYFNGGYLSFSSADTLSLGAASWTYSIWFKSTATSTRQLLMYKYGVTDEGYFLIRTQENTGKIYFLLREPNGSYKSIISTTMVTDGDWHHIVCTFQNNSSGNDNMALWIDGTKEAEKTDSSLGNLDSSTAMRIGQYCIGYMDEISVWDRVISNDEIAKLYNSGYGWAINVPTVDLQDKLVGYYCMEATEWDGTEGEVIDDSPSEFDGYAVGGANTSTQNYLLGTRSALFNGASNCYIDFGENWIYDMDEKSFSISAWFKSSYNDGRQFLFYKYAPAGQGYLLLRTYSTLDGNTGKLLFYLKDDKNVTSTVDSQSVVTDGEWHHVVITFENNPDGADISTIWVDGVMEDIEETTSLNRISSLYDFLIGRYVNGNMDEVAIWERVLNGKEIECLYNAGMGKSL